MQCSTPFVDVEKRGSDSSGDAIIDVEINSRAGTLVNKEVIGPKLSRAQIDAEIKTTKTIPLQEYPTGYPLQAAFQSSESSWSIYRGFSYLHARVILDLQDELRCLEENLEEIDLENEGEGRLRSRKDDLKFAKDQGIVSPRASLLDKIRTKLVSYDEILVKTRELNAFQRPSKRDYRSFRTWFWNKKPLSYELEEQFIKRKEDLVSLRHGREWSGFDGLIESCIQRVHCRLVQRIFATKELRDKTNDEHVHYYSQSRIEKLVGLIITLIIFILLVLPVVAMYKLTSVGDRNSTFDAVGILVVFTLLFSAAMSLLTKAKRHELFAASAAYCAVLVVFISNFSNDGSRQSG
ncbi:uncharacterized protein J4E84_000343 [Alternaria hordeiaustralica]|uniref:uncharacterized protein n=1 Tax=Alternaria hordeiaustralica TaxID=1187925 RepID=UPI0020C5012A|nr:uncharacterized protein J4E84_000343 [Alternaria hordeiaustralica]KAI4697216.1 hypothetical protein J4E84_000343 [Alternaria hordeiaustralica]